MKHQLTQEQEAIREAAVSRGESLMISAYAGCGKTSTLEMLAHALPSERALALAFNVKIKKELERRFPSHFDVLTLNGLGHRAWGRKLGKRLEVDERKLGKIVTLLLKEPGSTAASEDWVSVKDLVVVAMQQGLVPQQRGSERFPLGNGLLPDTPDVWVDLANELFIDRDAQERVIRFARSVLVKNVELAHAGNISFDDQVYMSTCYGGVFPRYPRVMVDESQDLSPANHRQVASVAGSDGRLFVVGDDKQAIYAFRGADSQSMSRLRTLRNEWIDLPLAITFRCPKVVVARQQAHAKGFTAFHTNPEGQFVQVGQLAPRKEVLLAHSGDFEPEQEELDPNWTYREVERLSGGREVAVLCRNNAPLLALAFKLLRQGVGVQFLGRDLGKQLVSLAKKLAKDDSTPVEELRIAIRAWMERETTLALANENDGLVAGITDRGECLLAVLDSEGVKTAGDLRSALTRLFERESGIVTLATGHRAKGLEWPLVVHLDPWRIPSRFAQKDPRQMQQEKNLLYVIETRTQATLVEANLEDFT